MCISLTVTLGDWYVYIYVKPASCESAIFPTALSGGSLSLQQVTGDALVYSNDLTYVASADSYNLAFTHPVVCAYERLVFIPTYGAKG